MFKELYVFEIELDNGDIGKIYRKSNDSKLSVGQDISYTMNDKGSIKIVTDYQKNQSQLSPKQNVDKKNLYYFKAICLDKLNKWKDSKNILVELISKNPNDAYILNYLSYSMAVRNEDLIKAKKLIIKALEIEQNNGFFLDTLGWIQFKLNDLDKAVRTIQLAIELEPDNSEIIDHLGDIYYKIGRKKEAIYEWNRALIGNALPLRVLEIIF